ncbi:MAG: GIY-YIG nuclease family protein [Saprospiraceae bacterium]|nr:GIY-YIG nuclease family protein [Saprospiraceae bacterium]
MNFAYALISCEHKFIYVGMTNNLVERIRRHDPKLSSSLSPFFDSIVQIVPYLYMIFY